MNPDSSIEAPHSADSALTWQHFEEPQEVERRLDTSIKDGLTTSDVRRRLEKNGPNILTPPLQTSWWLQLLSHFTDFFSLLLQFAATLCVVAYILDPSENMHIYLAGFLFTVVIATSLFSFAQQYKSDQTIREFRNMLPPKATVIRDGGFIQIVPAADLVVGDIVSVKMGDKIPADLRIVKSQRLAVDNSALTGESEPCERQVDMTSDIPLESSNLAFFGTLAVQGAGLGIVIATADETVFGHIAHLTTDAQSGAGDTTLHRDIHHFVVSITCFAVAVGVFFFVGGALKGTKLLRNLVYSIGIIVSNVPEGLLATVTVSLTASARRMSRRNVLVKKLDAIETLGATDRLCTDKTGTLTQNRMTVSHLAYDGKVEVVTPKWAPPVFAEEVTSMDPSSQDCLQSLIFGATNCSTAVFDYADSVENPGKCIDDRVISGDASEAGLLRFTECIHSVAAERSKNPVLASLPFNSLNKFMVTIHRVSNDSDYLRLVMKGAPERVLDRCSSVISKSMESGSKTMTGPERSLIEKQVLFLAARGERVLAFAQLDLSPQQASRLFPEGLSDLGNIDVDLVPTENLCFVGLISLVDPPRPNVPHAVSICKTAGISVIMVTGDHPATATSIAKQVGIISLPVAGEDDDIVDSSNAAIVVTGGELNSYGEADWDRALGYQQIVFARTSPHQKLLIVQNLQRLGHIVTATGDGINDAPALKMANTGVAMGICGSEVSKEAADIVLLDDNFASIVNGVEEGRLIFDNLKKSISYTLTSNVPQLLPFIVFLILQIPLPLTTVLILTIDLATDIFPAISLAYQEAEWDLMRRPPRSLTSNRLLNTRLLSFSMLQLGVIQSFAGFFAYLVLFYDYGLYPSTLPGLDSSARFGTDRLIDQRWMYTEQTQPGGYSFKASWFSEETPEVAAFFNTGTSGPAKGFIEQTEEQYNKVLASAKPMPPLLGQVTSSPQFNNMVKVIGAVTRRPPCLAFACLLNTTGNPAINDQACFDSDFNPNEVYLTGILDGKPNENVRTGQGVNEGCFDFWTPKQERGVLHAAQSGFFVAIVVCQMFTLLVTKTRMLSLFKQGVQNSAVIGSLVLELCITLLLIYLPAFQLALNISRLRFIDWLPGLPFGVLILLFDESRKWFIRRHAISMRRESDGIYVSNTLLGKFSHFIYDYTLW